MATRWFWNRMARGYAASPVSDEESYRKKLEITQGYLRPDMQVLELGCGPGTTAIEHSPHVAHLTGVDVSQEMLAIAEERAAKAEVTNLSWVCASFEEYDPGERKFDAVLALNILHLLDDPKDGIRRIHEMLEPGGVFVSSTICAGDAKLGLRAMAVAFRFLPIVPRIASYDCDGLAREIEQAGFEIDTRWRPREGPVLFAVARKR